MPSASAPRSTASATSAARSSVGLEDDRLDAELPRALRQRQPNRRAAVGAGLDFACALRVDQTIACWGDSAGGKTTPPGGVFSQLSVGPYHACALRSDGIMDCWGATSTGQSTPMPGTFMAVSSGGAFTCALRSDETLVCWGIAATPPTGAFTVVSSGAEHACALRVDGTVACWGNDQFGEASPPGGTFLSVAAGRFYTCGLRTDQTIACWGLPDGQNTAPPSGAFTSVQVGPYAYCGIRTDQTLACWGFNGANLPYNEATPPAGTYLSVSNGGHFGCAVRTDHTLVCWPSAAPAAASNPSAAPTPAATKPTPKPISAAKAFSLPSAKTCLSKRSFTIRIRKLAGVTWVSAAVRVHGKRVKTIKRSRITAPVNLRGLPKGRFTVAITAKAADGRVVTGKRTYHTCTASTARQGPSSEAPRTRGGQMTTVVTVHAMEQDRDYRLMVPCERLPAVPRDARRQAEAIARRDALAERPRLGSHEYRRLPRIAVQEESSSWLLGRAPLRLALDSSSASRTAPGCSMQSASGRETRLSSYLRYWASQAWTSPMRLKNSVM